MLLLQRIETTNGFRKASLSRSSFTQTGRDVDSEERGRTAKNLKGVVCHHLQLA